MNPGSDPTRPRAAHAAAIAVVFLAVGLAGCLGGDEPIDPPDPDASSEQGSEAGVEQSGVSVTDRAPTWRVGDYWVYEDSTGNRNTFVVTHDEGSDYIIDTDGDTFAFFDAIDDISTLGPQRKSDLAGSQGTARIEFFRFPLRDGDTWTTTWDGEMRRIVAEEMGRGVFGFVSTADDGTPHARYTYDAEAGWFGALEFQNEDGSTMFANRLVDAGSGFSGEVLRYEVEEVFARDDAVGAEMPAVVNGENAAFTQEADHTDVFLIYSGGCAAGVLVLHVAPTQPTDDSVGYSATAPCPKAEAFYGSLGSQPGDWGVAFVQGTGADAVASVQVYLRTQTVIEVTPVT